MNDSMPTFNLLDKPWLPCIPLGKSHAELFSLSDTLLQADSLRMIYADSPLITAASYRLCLTVLHRAFKAITPHKWKSLWQMRDGWKGEPRKELETYFQQWHGQFDLYGQGRFFQLKQKPEGTLSSVVSLSMGMASGHNPVVFDHHLESEEVRMNPSNAAQELLALQTFSIDTAAGRNARYPRSACAHGVIYFAEGNTLLETFLLNLFEIPTDRFQSKPGFEDQPAWEMADPFTIARPQGKPLGYFDYQTWHSRRIWLEVNSKVDESDCMSITGVYISPGLELPKDLLDPMKQYTPNKDETKKKEEPWSPVRFREARSLWRDSYTLFKPEDANQLKQPIFRIWLSKMSSKQYRYLDSTWYKLRAFALGMGSSSADILFWRNERMPLPLELLTEEAGELIGALSTAMKKAEDIAKDALYPALYQLATELISNPQSTMNEEASTDKNKSNKEKNKETKATKPDERLVKLIGSWNTEALYWSQLEPHYWSFVDTLVHTTEATGREAASQTWREVLRRTANSAFETTANAVGKTPRALKAVAFAQRQLRGRMSANTLLGPSPKPTESIDITLFDSKFDREESEELL